MEKETITLLLGTGPDKKVTITTRYWASEKVMIISLLDTRA
jgi:hypothetical protein